MSYNVYKKKKNILIMCYGGTKNVQDKENAICYSQID